MLKVFLIFQCFRADGVISPVTPSGSLPRTASREGTDMTGQQPPQPPRPSSRTTSAPTSPLKEKKSGFLGKMTNISQVGINLFSSMAYKNRLISAGSELVLCHTKKSRIPSHYRQFSTIIKIKIIKFIPVLLALAFD